MTRSRASVERVSSVFLTLSFADDNEAGIQARRETAYQPMQSTKASVGTGDGGLVPDAELFTHLGTICCAT